MESNVFEAEPGTIDPVGQLYYDFSNKRVSKLNCTDVYTNSVTSGFPDHGNYSGVVGIMQRNEAEMCMQTTVRIDSLEFEPIRVGGVMSAADAIFVSPIENGTEFHSNIIGVVKRFDGLTYFDFVICFMLVMVVNVCGLCLKSSVGKTASRRMRLIVRKTISILWSAFETVVSQDTYDPISLSARFSWLFFTTATFCAVAVLLNLMSTDQVAQIQAPRIQSIDDMLSVEFSHYKPVVFKVLYLYSLMLSAKPETKIGRLFRKISRNGNEGVIGFDGSKVDDMLELFKPYGRANTSVAIGRCNYEWAMKPLFCGYQPNVIAKTYLSQGSFAEGIQAFIFNKHMDRELERYLSYQTTTNTEFDLTRIFLNTAGSTTARRFGFDSGREVMQCNSGIPIEENFEQMISGIELTPLSLHGTFKVCGVLLAMAVMALALEFVANRFMSRFNRQRFSFLTRP